MFLSAPLMEKETIPAGADIDSIQGHYNCNGPCLTLRHKDRFPAFFWDAHEPKRPVPLTPGVKKAT